VKCLEHCDATRKIKPKKGENALVTQNRNVYRLQADSQNCQSMSPLACRHYTETDRLSDQ